MGSRNATRAAHCRTRTAVAGSSAIPQAWRPGPCGDLTFDSRWEHQLNVDLTRACGDGFTHRHTARTQIRALARRNPLGPLGYVLSTMSASAPMGAR